jgi:hypothetical protein
MHECRAVGGIKIGRGNQILGEKLSQYHFIHHNSNMTTGIEPWPQRWDTGD